MKVTNLTRNTVLAVCLEVADSGAKRSKGLLGRKGLAPGEGLWIVPCESVHTFFMQFPIDLVYLDRKHRVRKVRSNVPPWRMSACLYAHSILELPSGTIRETKTKPGDVVEFSEAMQLAEVPEGNKPFPNVNADCMKVSKTDSPKSIFAAVRSMSRRLSQP
jgi:uncharacterized membrane protein (UPF0127 family)